MADNDVQAVVDQVHTEPTPPAADAQPAAPLDPDDAEVAAAHAAAEAEAKPAAAAAEPAQPAAAAPAAAAPAGEPITVPKTRLDDVLAQGRAKDAEIARLAGVVEGMKLAAPKSAATPAAEPAAPTDTVQAVRTERLALAEKFDNGEISMKQLRSEEAKLDDREEAIRDAKNAANLRNIQPSQEPVGDLRLEERTAELEAAHPYASAPEVTNDAHFMFLWEEAHRQLQTEGANLPTAAGQRYSPAQQFAVRERIAVLSDTYGPLWGAKPATPTAAAPKPAVTTTKPAPGSVAAARAAKLDAAQAAPPDVNRLAQAGQAELTDSQIETMSDEEIAALPASVKARLLS